MPYSLFLYQHTYIFTNLIFDRPLALKHMHIHVKEKNVFYIYILYWVFLNQQVENLIALEIYTNGGITKPLINSKKPPIV